LEIEVHKQIKVIKMNWAYFLIPTAITEPLLKNPSQKVVSFTAARVAFAVALVTSKVT